MSQILAEFPSDEHVLRPLQPRLQLLLYGDYSCARTAMYDGVIREALSETPEDVAYIYRHFPLDAVGHRAAGCAIAAGFQDRFWAMHAWLLTHQSQLDDASLVEHAVILRLDVAQFLKDLAGSKPRAKIETDRSRAVAAGVADTPGIFIQGQRLPSHVSVDQALSRLRTTSSR